MDEMPDARRTTVVTIVLSASAFVFTPFFFTPARIAIGNFMELSSLFRESAVFFLVLSAVLTSAAIAALLSLKRPRAVRTTLSVVCALAFLMWLQGTFLVWKYGVLNGREIEWAALARYGIIDSLIWAAVMAFAVVKANLVFRGARVLCIVLLAVQSFSVVQAWAVMPKDQSFKQKEYATDTLFQFSRHVNVIVLVLDTFQSDIFQDLVRERPDLRAAFDGFTYFRNSLAGSDATTTSVPYMLTARNYDNATPYLDFVKQAYLENSLPKILRQYGFSIDLYPILPYSIYDDFSGVALPPRKLMNWASFLREQAFLVDLSLFRVLPHFAKELVYRDQRWLVSAPFTRRQASAEARDSEKKDPGSAASPPFTYEREYQVSAKPANRNWDTNFLHKMVPRSATAENPDAFKFYHLNGMHLQLVMNEDLEHEFQLPTRTAMERQGIAVLKIAAIFLERLRQLGVYDNSLIFIVGDHGSGLSAASINPSAVGAHLNRSGPYRGFFQNFKSAGIPLVLVKRIRARGPLRLSDAPVSLGDIPQTVVSELGLQGKFPGESMFQLKENQARERVYRAFLGPQEDVVFMAPLWEYAVNGFSWDDRSWRETGNVYYPKGR